MKALLKRFVSLFGYTLARIPEMPEKSTEYDEFIELYEFCRPYTMTSIERMFALYKSIEYIVKNDIPGDFVECGVWRGGSAMLMALTLLKFKQANRKIYLFDTYEGMSAPTEDDVDIHRRKASDQLEATTTEKQNSIWCLATYDTVQQNVISTNYPADNFKLIKGMVEDTIPANNPGQLALLRLDTDWYASTKHELTHLFPLLAGKGVLIIDDYGHWQGARKAVDEYIAEKNIPILLNRVDYTGRVAIKVA